MAVSLQLCDLSADDVLAGSAPSIRDHSLRHARLSVRIGHSMSLPPEQIRMLRSIGWAHDIGGGAKTTHEAEHKRLLRLEFTRAGLRHGVKPSFNPRICFAHAEQRIALGSRGPLTPEEKRDPFPLYVEEFELLKGEPLTAIEAKVLSAWWYHPLYAIEILQQWGIDFPPEVEVVIRCNEQPWLLETDERIRQLADASRLSRSALQRLIAVVRAADILENGNNRYRRVELRGVPIEDFRTTAAFLDYKFALDGLEDHRDVLTAVYVLLRTRDDDFLAALFEARESSVLLPADVSYLESRALTLRASPN